LGRGAPRLFRERTARRRSVLFALKDARPSSGLPLALSRLVGVFGASARARLGFAFTRRAERNAGSPRLGQAYCDRLLRLAAANLPDFLMHEFASLG